MRVTLVVLVVLVAPAVAAPRPVTVYLDRHGQSVTRDDGDEVEIPAFGGTDRVWEATVACVRKEFAPFQVELSDQRPRGGTYITVLVGGKASLMGLDDSTTDGIGPYSGKVIPGATVHVFSKIAGERNARALCAVAAHEIGHSLGLDHEYKCGDLMSYFNDQCGTQHFLDVTVRCGEGRQRRCSNGDATQNSYQRLAKMVGLREDGDAPTADPSPDVADTDDTGTSDADDTDDTDDTATTAPADPWDGRAVAPDDNRESPPDDNRAAPDGDDATSEGASDDASDTNDGYAPQGRTRPDPSARGGRRTRRDPRAETGRRRTRLDPRDRGRSPRSGRRRRAIDDSATEDNTTEEAPRSNRGGCGKRWHRAR